MSMSKMVKYSKLFVKAGSILYFSENSKSNGSYRHHQKRNNRQTARDIG
jgi:hypothetical protein